MFQNGGLFMTCTLANKLWVTSHIHSFTVRRIPCCHIWLFETKMRTVKTLTSSLQNRKQYKKNSFFEKSTTRLYLSLIKPVVDVMVPFYTVTVVCLKSILRRSFYATPDFQIQYSVWRTFHKIVVRYFGFTFMQNIKVVIIYSLWLSPIFLY